MKRYSHRIKSRQAVRGNRNILVNQGSCYGNKKRRQARSSRLLSPLSGMSGQPDGGRLAGRVLAYLYNPGRAKKVPEKMKKWLESSWKLKPRAGVIPPYATPLLLESR
jgi:hypothetical protein